MKRLLSMIFVLGLMLCIGSAQAGMGGNCSPEGTWYGNNDAGNEWIVTIDRSGPTSFTCVMDYGVNLPFEGVMQQTDYRGEFVKTGPHQFDWTTMAYGLPEPGGIWDPFDYLLALCPLTAEFTDCDSFEGGGVCEVYGFFAGQDPFEEGVFLLAVDELQASFKRMPMTFPVP